MKEKKEKIINKSKKKKNLYTKRNMMHSILTEYQAIVQANKLCKTLPIFNFNDDILKNAWQPIAEQSNTLAVFRTNERHLSKNGESMIGFKKVVDPLTKELSTVCVHARPLMYLKHLGQLVYLLIEYDRIVSENKLNYIICEEYVQDLNQVTMVAVSEQDMQNYMSGQTATVPRLNPNEIQTGTIDGEPVFYHIDRLYTITHLNAIPFALFENNEQREADLFFIERSLFMNMDDSIRMARQDIVISRAFAWINEKIAKDTNIKEIIKDPTQNVITSRNSSAMMGGTGVQILQGTTQADAIWRNYDENMKIVKEFGFIKVIPADMGGNNKQTAEIDALSENVDDFLEAKANLREMQYKDMAKVWVTFENEWNILPLFNSNTSKWEILVSHSTKSNQVEQERTLKLSKTYTQNTDPNGTPKTPQENDTGGQ